jgi:hypothetical protein
MIQPNGSYLIKHLLLGLEAQLLGIVVRKEKPELEEMKDNLVLNIAAGKKKLEELEDTILRSIPLFYSFCCNLESHFKASFYSIGF